MGEKRYMYALINTVFGVPLGYLMYFSYKLVGNYGMSIIVFTLLTKILMFPLSLVSQKNSIKMVKMQPRLDEIKQRYAGNAQQILLEQKKLYKEEKYSSFASMLPLFIQIPIILGLINVIYNPLQHLIHLDSGLIANLANKAGELLGSGIPAGAAAQIEVLNAVKSSPDLFAGLFNNAKALSDIKALDFMFLGFDLAQKPSLSDISLFIPLLSGLSSFLLSALQNKHNVLQREQGFIGKWGMAAFLVAFSTYFAFIVPMGIGVYWIAGNYLSIPVLFLSNLVTTRINILTMKIGHKSRSLPRRKERTCVRKNGKTGKGKTKIPNAFFPAPKSLFSIRKAAVFTSILPQ